jgi:hypothetical protein
VARSFAQAHVAQDDGLKNFVAKILADIVGVSAKVNGQPLALDSLGRAEILAGAIGRTIIEGFATDVDGLVGQTEAVLKVRDPNDTAAPVVAFALGQVGTRFTGNGDFFGLAFNSDYQTNVLGFGNDPGSPWKPNAPGPTIVGGIRYDPSLPFERRITVEDLSFPKAYVSAAMVAFGAIGGVATGVGGEKEGAARRQLDNPSNPYQADNAMNHTMLYLVMGHDDARGNLYSVTDPEIVPQLTLMIRLAEGRYSLPGVCL